MRIHTAPGRGRYRKKRPERGRPTDLRNCEYDAIPLDVSNPCFLFRRFYWSKSVCTDDYIPYIVYKYQCAPHQQNYLLLTAKGIALISVVLTAPLDMIGCMSACFEWADSYDSKDWERLKNCIAPTLRVRYTLPKYLPF